MRFEKMKFPLISLGVFAMMVLAVACSPSSDKRQLASPQLKSTASASTSSFASSSVKLASKATVVRTPTVKLTQIPTFDDDLNFKGLSLSIAHQQAAFDRLGLKGSIILGGKTFPLSILQKSLSAFKEAVTDATDCIKGSDRKACLERFNDVLQEKFDFYGPTGDQTGTAKKVHFTGYYSPVFKASLTKTEEFPYAIYRSPDTENLRRKTREQIIFEGALEGLGLEIFYISDLFDLYILHLEGGGAVDIDGQIRYLSYQGYNSNKFNFISKYMKAQNYIDDVSTMSQKAYLDAHPEKWREIYSYCPGYIYFTESFTPPLGLEDIPLTDNRSIAQDRKYYSRKGLIAFIRAERPVKENGAIVMKPMTRFYLDQDTGSAIKGEARADIYFGFGEEASLAGQYLNTYGDMIYLIAK